jgi:uncharacterized protein with PQ loop repeat
MFDTSPHLPEHCTPSNEFLRSISLTFSSCVPTPLALLSTILGCLSITAWLFAQVPQIIKNFNLRSTSGLSVFFLGEWLLGDVSNLLGSLFTGQATWQVVLATYYCTVDCVLVGQWIWYEYLKHGRTVRRVRWWRRSRAAENKDLEDDASKAKTPVITVDGIPALKNGKPAKSKPIAAKGKIPGPGLSPDFTGSEESSWKPSSLFSRPQFASYSSVGSTLTDSPPTSSSNARPILRVPRPESPTPSPRTVLFITLLICVVARASPVASQNTLSSSLHSSHARKADVPLIQWIGGGFSWLSTLLYLGSRLPQLLHNHSRRSTEGLSPTLFLAAFFGNLFYSSSIVTNPSLWSDLPPYGSGGWAGPEGTLRGPWATRAAPFFLGAAGVLLMDAAVGMQFLMYAPSAKNPQSAAVLVVEAEGVRGAGRWRRVSGWMRGWVPAAAARSSSSSSKNGSGRKQRAWSVLTTDGYGYDTGTETDSLLTGTDTSNGANTPRAWDAGSVRSYGGTSSR